MVIKPLSLSTEKNELNQFKKKKFAPQLWLCVQSNFV